MQKLVVAPVICLAMLLAGRISAQNAPPAETGPAIRVTTTEVLLDLVVRDKRGRQVKNLKPDDVEIYEDGVSQKILSFRPVATHEVQRRESGIEAKRGQGTVSPRSLHAVNVVCIVFHNLDPVARTRAIEAVQEFIRNDLQPETYVGVFNLNDPLTAVYPVTNNRKELLQAAQTAFTGRP